MDDLENIYTKYTPKRFNSDEIFSSLSFLSDLLSKHNIKHWLMYGTLLGCVRENNVIDYDYDFDIGIYYKDKEQVFMLNEEIKDTDYSIVYGKALVYNCKDFKTTDYLWRVSYKFCFKNIEIGDIYIYDSFDDGYMRRFDREQNIYFIPNTTFPEILILKLSKGILRNKEFPIPIRSELLVEYWYGPHWKTPIVSKSQEGDGHEDYDFFGNYKYSSLDNFVEKLNKEDEIIILNGNKKIENCKCFNNVVIGNKIRKGKTTNFRCGKEIIDVGSDKINVEICNQEKYCDLKCNDNSNKDSYSIIWTSPPDQIKWLERNEKVIIEKDYMKQLKKKGLY